MVEYSLKKQKHPKWLENVLESSLENRFFSACTDHGEIRKNEMNVFCVDCNSCICQHCLSSSHLHHNTLQIRKYVYHDVINLNDLQKLLDCSKVQTYTINRAKVVCLNPRPQSKPQSKSNGGPLCVCERNLTEPHRYCSIACKVSGVDSKAIDERRLFNLCHESIHTPFAYKEHQNSDPQVEESVVSSVESPLSTVENHLWLDSALNLKKRLCKRKGIPRRAPFF
ncbi:protein RGF1 INDUCIBLE TRANSCRIPTION FACTOR 1-like [Tasmannia lanceolata]|uniref:protein RGF1 INDUCIBLE TRANSCRIPTION FACTOR 1-like n=1 Tax=Tasmannia lanceolata TaxID=3420 RepID=UPI004064BD46